MHYTHFDFSIFVGLRPQYWYHLIKNITGEEVVLYVSDLHSHWDAVVIGPLLQEGR